MAPLRNEEGDAAYFSGEEESSTTISSSSSSPLTSSNRDGESSSLTITRQARRSVSFSTGASIHLGAVLNIDDYTETERCECWYQLDEMREIRRDVKDTVALMNRNVPMHELSRFSDGMNDADIDATITTHGLEGKTRAGKRHRKETRLASLAAVFDEQTLQEMDGVCDPTMIAMAYAEYSYPMQVAAFQRAAQYQKEAAAIYRIMQETDNHHSSPDHMVFTSADSSGSANAETVVGPIKYNFDECRSKRSSDNNLDLEKSGGDLDHASFSVPNGTATSSESTADGTDNSSDENNNIEYIEDNDDTDGPYNAGPLRIRDRFACLLPGSAAKSTPSLIGAFRVVQI